MPEDQPRHQIAVQGLPDPRYASIRVDTHFFDDSIGTAERAAADRLIELAGALELTIATPHSVWKELDDPRTPAETRRRAAELIYTLDTGTADAGRLAAARQLMQGNARTGKHHKDADH